MRGFGFGRCAFGGVDFAAVSGVRVAVADARPVTPKPIRHCKGPYFVHDNAIDRIDLAAL
jgi:hypothetical protein